MQRLRRHLIFLYKMKKNQFLYTAAMLIPVCAATMMGCGSSKKLSGEQEIADNACEVLANEKLTMRVYGEGQHFDKMSATSIAEATARATWQRRIEVAIKNATDLQTDQHTKYGGDEKSSSSASDQRAGSNVYVQAIAQGIAANLVVIKTCKYMLPNQQFKIGVTLEYILASQSLQNRLQRKLEIDYRRRKKPAWTLTFRDTASMWNRSSQNKADSMHYMDAVI